METEWWKENSDIKEELNDKPMLVNKTDNIKNSEWGELHDKMAQVVIDFFKEKGLPTNAYMVSFSFDDLESSVNYGQWTPMSDSSLSLIDRNRETLIWSA